MVNANGLTRGGVEAKQAFAAMMGLGNSDVAKIKSAWRGLVL